MKIKHNWLNMYQVGGWVGVGGLGVGNLTRWSKYGILF